MTNALQILSWVWSLYFAFVPDPLSGESIGFLRAVINHHQTAASTWGVVDQAGNFITLWWAQVMDFLLNHLGDWP